jgi:hypothetical protein
MNTDSGRPSVTTRVSALVVSCLLCASQAWAQQSIVGGTRARITDRMVVGGSTFGEVMRIVGSPTVSSGTGTQNPAVIDADGDVLEDNNTTVSTAGAWTWSAAGSFTSTLGVTGLLSGNTGALLLGTSRLTGTAPELQWNETDQGTNLKNWREIVSGSQYALQALDDSYGSLGDLIRGYRRSTADLYGGIGSPVTFEWGQYVRNALPAQNNTLIFGSPVKQIGGLYVNELVATVFTVLDKQVIGNGSFRVGRGASLTRDLTSGATTIYVNQRVFRYHDFGLLQGLGSSGQPQFEAIRIVQAGGYDCTEGDSDTIAGNGTTLPSACNSIDNNDYAITVERNKDTGSANSWISGDGVVATDRYLDLYAWQSAVITGGGAIMGDRPLAYWNFNGPSTTQVNRAAESGGTITALNSTGAGSGGGFAGDGDNWNRNSLADAQIFSGSIAEMNSGTAGGTELACSMSIEMVYYVTGSTPGSANSKRPIAKWDGASTSTVTFLVEHWGSAAGGTFNGKMALLGTPVANPITILTPIITPSAGAWHHIVFTYSNVNGGKAYIDGVATGTPTSPVAAGACMVTNSNNITGELWGNNGNPFGGHISELAVYATELSANQAYAHYQAFQTNRVGLSAGPTVAGYERTSETNWYGVSERWACGNLVDLFGFQQVTYGCGWGDTSATYVTATASDGFSIWNAGTRKFWADTSGNLSLTGTLAVSTSGEFKSGDKTCVAGVGSGWLMSYNGGNPVFCFGDTTNSMEFTTSGALEIRSAQFKVLSGGVYVGVKTNTTFGTNFGYNFSSTFAGTTPSLWAYETSTERRIRLDNKTTQSGRTAGLSFAVDDEDADAAALTISTGTAASAGDSEISVSGINFTVSSTNLVVGGNTGLTTTIVLPCGTVTYTKGVLTNKGTC